MSFVSLSSPNDFQPAESSEIELFDDTSVNHALIAVALEVAKLLERVNFSEVDSSNDKCKKVVSIHGYS
ncbi:hypothetical protein [Myxosarcina sp. GI1]|uniref:hypothetical protein n=1 Tax=Myxosarcina sp. GI1 TaxID=1541065 RepID=UPI00055D3817|nr:hypothetical protein [Myxosarcina sp. GI1]